MDNVKDNVKIFFGCEDVHSLMFFIIFQEVILDFGQFFDRQSEHHKSRYGQRKYKIYLCESGIW